MARARQTAYHIRVVGTRDKLVAGTPDLSDSGRIDSEQSIDIEYAGKHLPSDARFWWQVRLWDEENVPAHGRRHRRFSPVGCAMRCAPAAVDGGWVAPIPRHGYPDGVTLPAHLPEAMPFRYAELPLKQPAASLLKLFQRALFYPFDETAARFESSDKVLDAVWEVGRYTLQATPFLGVYVDGERQRIPYEGDAYIRMLGHYAVGREFAVQRSTHEFLLRNPTWPTEWQMHSLFMAWEDYMATGNSESLVRNYGLPARKTLVGLARSDGLISTTSGRQDKAFLAAIALASGELRDLVDWPPLLAAGVVGLDPVPGETDSFVFTDYNAVVNTFHYRALRTMADIARALDRDADAR